jgi:REP element-mobilizing transposase RayT
MVATMPDGALSPVGATPSEAPNRYIRFMANTYSQVSIHCIFAVKGRENVLVEKLRPQLFRYMSGILKNHGAFPLAINGWTDHVHVFFELPMTLTISELMRDLKASSSKWINENGHVKGRFQWQEGYSAFSYARSQRDDVVRYIQKQEEHHAKRSFREEYLDFLQRFEVAYDDRYVFEFFD